MMAAWAVTPPKWVFFVEILVDIVDSDRIAAVVAVAPKHVAVAVVIAVPLSASISVVPLLPSHILVAGQRQKVGPEAAGHIEVLEDDMR